MDGAAQLRRGAALTVRIASWLRDEEALTATVTATLAASPYRRRTSATVHALAAAQDLAVCYT